MKKKDLRIISTVHIQTYVVQEYFITDHVRRYEGGGVMFSEVSVPLDTGGAGVGTSYPGPVWGRVWGGYLEHRLRPEPQKVGFVRSIFLSSTEVYFSIFGKTNLVYGSFAQVYNMSTLAETPKSKLEEKAKHQVCFAPYSVLWETWNSSVFNTSQPTICISQNISQVCRKLTSFERMDFCPFLRFLCNCGIFVL